MKGVQVVFSSIAFLTLFLPLVLVIYHFLFLFRSSKGHPEFHLIGVNVFLLTSSLLFYFWGEGWRVGILAFSCIANFWFAWLMMWRVTRTEIGNGIAVYGLERVEKLEPGGARTGSQKFLLIIAVVTNLGFLAYYKYFNFFVENISPFSPSEWKIKNWTSVALPLGISFYTFQAMSYVIDVYRGNVPATRSLITFSCYLTMFQQLVAGPIVRYRDVYRQLTDRTISRSQFASGASRFIIGLSKKVLIANTVAIIADKAFEIPPDQLTTATAWLGIVCYTLQIYYDFSAYSDMAIGLGRMFGFEFLENFNYPYIATSARDFWQRWHISLSTWFRDYLYIPLGGDRKGPSRTHINLLIVFVLCGFWHGANWVFIAWGLYHGFFLVLERLIGFHNVPERDAPKWTPLLSFLGHGYALLMIMGGWVLFRSDTFSQTLGYYAALMGYGKGSASANAIWLFYAMDVQIAVASGIIFAIPVLPVIKRWWLEVQARNRANMKWGWSMLETVVELGRTALLLGLLILCFMPLASGTLNPFIYFRF